MKRDYVTIVSGLPRSGTSMMMRMLDEAGLPALTDQLRAADASNPKGYYEYEPVKTTKEDPAWLLNAFGKAVKMVHLLLLDLPLTHNREATIQRGDASCAAGPAGDECGKAKGEPPLPYMVYRVVFMHRDIGEIIESQNTMLERLGRKSDDMPKERLTSIFRAQVDDVLRYVRRHADYFALMEIDYNTLVEQPLPEAERVSLFLDGLDVAKMTAVVDQNLYRTRRVR